MPPARRDPGDVWRDSLREVPLQSASGYSRSQTWPALVKMTSRGSSDDN